MVHHVRKSIGRDEIGRAIGVEYEDNEELKGEEISVVALAPSTIDTPANRKDMPTAKHDTWVKPAAIAELVLAHCSLSDAINSGALIPIYGRA